MFQLSKTKQKNKGMRRKCLQKPSTNNNNNNSSNRGIFITRWPCEA